MYNFIKNQTKENEKICNCTNDSLNFEQEYEKLNKTVNSNNDKEYLTVELSSYLQ